MTAKRWWLLAVVALVVTACAAGPNAVSHVDGAAGFWKGLWHGFIYPVTFVISLFTDTVNLYEVRNNGNWYDFGFVCGVGLLHGGVHVGQHTSKRRTTRISEETS